ncbi:SpoIIE family protein phosphatase [candidate division KSB1 bacterium]|nr:SpoIIE family protein phosphatase [candidate division KSB1 bacterium]
MTILFSIIYLTGGVLLLFLGFIILNDNPHQKINRIFSNLLFFAVAGSIMAGCGLLIQPVASNQFFLNRIFVFWEFFFPQLLIFSFFYPAKISSKSSQYQKLIFLPHLFRFILLIVFNSPDEIILQVTIFSSSIFENFFQPIAILGTLLLNLLAYFYEVQNTIFAFINLFYLILAFSLMYQSYHQMKRSYLPIQKLIVPGGILISVLLYVVAFLLPELLPLKLTFQQAHLLTTLSILLAAISIAWAIIKYHFLNIHFFIRKSILFSTGTAFLVGCYLLSYNITKQFTGQVFGKELPILEILFLIFAAFFFQPILSALERFLEKYFLKEQLDYRLILEEFSRDMLTILDLDRLREKISTILKRVLSVESVHLILKHKNGEYTVSRPNFNEILSFERSGAFIRLINQKDSPRLFNEIAPQIRDNTELRQLEQLQAYLFIPIAFQNELEGILCVGENSAHTPFSLDEKSLLRIMASQIAIALENFKLYEEKIEKQLIKEEISLASEIQRMLLPQTFPSGNHFAISAINIPSKEVGGDYYDFIQIEEEHLGIAIGDIAGKGIPGALLMSNLQATFRVAAQLSPNPAEVMRIVNTQIAKTTAPEKYATFFYGIFNIKDSTFTYTNAGHNFPILLHHDRGFKTLDKSDLVIGIDENYQYRQHCIKLFPGDFLICYTDGITEALNVEKIEFGENRLRELITSHEWHSSQDLRNYIYETIHKFSHGTDQYDDMTLVIFQIK